MTQAAGLRLSLRVANEPSEIPRLALRVEAFCRGHGASAQATHAVNLALDEALSNVIAYAFPEGGRHAVEVAIEAVPGREIRAEVVDDGRPFDPLRHKPSARDLTLAERRPGGHGIAVIRHVMDRVEYRREAGRNHLTLVKHLSRND